MSRFKLKKTTMKALEASAEEREAAHSQVPQPGAGAHILAVPSPSTPTHTTWFLFQLDVPSSYSSPAAWPPLLHLIVANEVEK